MFGPGVVLWRPAALELELGYSRRVFAPVCLSHWYQGYFAFATLQTNTSRQQLPQGQSCSIHYVQPIQ